MHSENEVVYLHLDDIIPNRFQPREVFDERALKELAISIKEHGVIQPIIVRNIGSKYEIIAGERRYKASALAGLTKIPAIVRNLDDKESSKVALLENLQRRNLNPIEEARTYQKILELDQMTQEELAKTMGKSQSAVANKLRLLALTDEAQQALLKEQISERHARTLLNFENPEEQKEMVKKVIESRMTVRELEQEIKKDEPQNKEDEMMINLAAKEETPELKIPNDEIQLGSVFSPQNAVRPQLMDNIDGNPNYLNNNISFEEKESDMENQEPAELPKFINYGEIDPDEEEEDADGENYSFGPSTAASPIDISALKENTRDINTEEKKIADLDSLLKINPVPTMPTDEKEEKTPDFKFFSSQQEEKESKEERTETPKTPDISSFFGNAPSTNAGFNTSLFKDSLAVSTPDNKKLSVKEAIDKIRENIKELEKAGVNIDSDEINFENSYQIVIKINKNN